MVFQIDVEVGDDGDHDGTTALDAGASRRRADRCALVEDETGGRVFIRGELVFAWNAGDELGRRLAAVQLVAIKGARAVRVAEGFGINTETLRRWDHAAANDGIAALVPGRRGPKGPSRLSPAVVADIRARRRGVVPASQCLGVDPEA